MLSENISGAGPGHRARSPSGREFPFISIIIPTYERPEALRFCLESLVRLDYPRDRFEVVVVDDGSPESPETLVVSFHDRLDVKLIARPHGGPAASRNAGAAGARGEFLAFTDDDCEPLPDWLKNLAARFAEAPDCMLGGRTLNGLPANLYSTASQVLVDYLYAHYNADASRARFFASNNLAVPAQHFHELGGFDETYTRTAAEDRELCDRWLSRGMLMTYVPEALVNHSHALTLRSFLRQHSRYGSGAFRFHRARARRKHTRIWPEPWPFYWNMLRFPFSCLRCRQALFLALLIGISQVAHLAGFILEWA